MPLAGLRDQSAAANVGGIFVRHADGSQGLANDLLLHAGSTWQQVTAAGGVVALVCGDSSPNGDFSGSYGPGGGGGKGGPGAAKRCPGFHPTLTDVCIKPPTTSLASCHRSLGGDCVSPAFSNLSFDEGLGLDGCYASYQYPDDAGNCPNGFNKQPLTTAPCPTIVKGPGGVACQAPTGPEVLGNARRRRRRRRPTTVRS